MQKINKLIHEDVPATVKEVKVFTRVYFWTIATFIFVVGLVYCIQYVSGYHVEIVKNIISPIGGK